MANIYVWIFHRLMVLADGIQVSLSRITVQISFWRVQPSTMTSILST